MSKAIVKTVCLLALAVGAAYAAVVTGLFSLRKHEPSAVLQWSTSRGAITQTMNAVAPTGGAVQLNATTTSTTTRLLQVAPHDAQGEDATASEITTNELITQAKLMVGNLTVPFTDTFDVRKRREWRLLSGDTIVKDGQLYSVGQVILQIGDARLKNYTVEFDTGAFTNFSWGETLRVNAYNNGYCWMEGLKGAAWTALVEIPCWTRNGRLRIEVANGETTTITFYDDGEKQSTVSYETNGSLGPFTLGFQGWIDNFMLTVP